MHDTVTYDRRKVTVGILFAFTVLAAITALVLAMYFAHNRGSGISPAPVPINTGQIPVAPVEPGPPTVLIPDEA